MKRLADGEIAAALASLPGWRRDGDALFAEYRFADFNAAFAFMTAVAASAESMQHHPDWSNSYARVRVSLTTHDAGGITARDVELARSVAQQADAHGGRAAAAASSSAATGSAATGPAPGGSATGAYPRDIPPQWFLGSMAAMLLAFWLWPEPRLVHFPWTLAGAVAMAAGLLLMLWAAGLFRRIGTGVRPFTEATELVARGPFRWTRNPMYLGMATILVGAAVAMGTPATWIVPPAFAALIQVRFIRREERFLHERFGAAYDEYRRRVRRWL